MSKKADLHVHTVFSDGKLTPLEVIKEACRRDIAAVGITDHDTMRGVPQALRAGQKYDVEVVPGVEMSTDFGGQEVHIIGYYCRTDNPLLKKTLTFVREDRYNRIVKMIDRLKKMGIEIPLEDVLKLATGGESLGRPHLAEALTQKGYCKTPREAFELFLDNGKPAFVKRLKIASPVAIRIIRKSGGIPILAHPGLYKDDSIISRLIKHGIMGIEAYHPDHRTEAARRYYTLGKQLNLLITGGTDFHCQNKVSAPALGSVFVEYCDLDMLKKAAGVV